MDIHVRVEECARELSEVAEEDLTLDQITLMGVFLLLRKVNQLMTDLTNLEEAVGRLEAADAVALGELKELRDEVAALSPGQTVDQDKIDALTQRVTDVANALATAAEEQPAIPAETTETTLGPDGTQIPVSDVPDDEAALTNDAGTAVSGTTGAEQPGVTVDNPGSGPEPAQAVSEPGQGIPVAPDPTSPSVATGTLPVSPPQANPDQPADAPTTNPDVPGAPDAQGDLVTGPSASSVGQEGEPASNPDSTPAPQAIGGPNGESSMTPPEPAPQPTDADGNPIPTPAPQAPWAEDGETPPEGDTPAS